MPSFRNMVSLVSEAITETGGNVLNKVSLVNRGSVGQHGARLDGQTIVVTGGNTGIGKEVARELFKLGARSVLGCRSTALARETVAEVTLGAKTSSSRIIANKLDLASLESVNQFAETLLKTVPKIDALVCNAGVMATTRRTTVDGFETNFGVNHLGHFLLILRLIDRMKQSPSAKVITMGSTAHQSQGAAGVIHCITSASGETGLYYMDDKVKKPSQAAQDDQLARQLWEVSCEKVGMPLYKNKTTLHGDSASCRKVVKSKRRAKTKENEPLNVDHAQLKIENEVPNPVRLDDVNKRLEKSKERKACFSFLNSQTHRPLSGQSLKWSFKTKVVKELLIPKLTPIRLSVYQVNSPRIRALEWHPRIPHLLLATGDYGDVLCIRDFEPSRTDTDATAGPKNFLIQDGGAGGLTTIRFDPIQDDVFYSASLTGQVCRTTLDYRENQSIFRTDDSGGNHWFTGLDVHPSNKKLYVGDTRGYLHIMPQDGTGKYEHFHLHKSKIHCVDIHPRNHNILATTSVDHTAKIWDIRNLKSEFPLEVLEFDGVVNSGFFRKSDGGKFVTVSTQKEGSIQIFNSANWKPLHSIDHHNDIFPTPVRATWHPLADIIVVGNFGARHKEHSNAIDFIDAESGDIVFNIDSSEHVGMKILNVFNCQGDSLASSMRNSVIVWKQQVFSDRGQLSTRQDYRSDNDDDSHRSKPRRRKNFKKNL
ncbi:DNA damage-binding protein 2 [Halotydeus destructor]|nr:DNA damage-binding protein 2 [Halotydeus destructor]